MFISGMTVENYRTFQNVSFHFDSQVNYIVGDNNIGKSNFLSLLKSATHGYGFKEADFLDPDLPIRVTFDLTTKDEGGNDSIRIELKQSVRRSCRASTIWIQGKHFLLNTCAAFSAWILLSLKS